MQLGRAKARVVCARALGVLCQHSRAPRHRAVSFIDFFKVCHGDGGERARASCQGHPRKCRRDNAGQFHRAVSARRAPRPPPGRRSAAPCTLGSLALRLHQAQRSLAEAGCTSAAALTICGSFVRLEGFRVCIPSLPARVCALSRSSLSGARARAGLARSTWRTMRCKKTTSRSAERSEPPKPNSSILNPKP